MFKLGRSTSGAVGIPVKSSTGISQLRRSPIWQNTNTSNDDDLVVGFDTLINLFPLTLLRGESHAIQHSETMCWAFCQRPLPQSITWLLPTNIPYSVSLILAAVGFTTADSQFTICYFLPCQRCDSHDQGSFTKCSSAIMPPFCHPEWM